MKSFGVPPNETAGENRKATSVGAMVVSAILTLTVLSVLAAFNPKAMFVAAGAGFMLFLVRFIWLVWRKLQ